MPSVYEHFKNDFKNLKIESSFSFKLMNSSSGLQEGKLDILEQIIIDLECDARFFSFYIPRTPSLHDVIVAVLKILPERADHGLKTKAFSNLPGDVVIGKNRALYAYRVYFYIEESLSEDEIESLDKYANQLGLVMVLRGPEYARERMEVTTPLAFISHDSRDKDLIARTLANGLSSRLCIVWYDEFSLKIGDSLRESIENGIKKAKKCVLIITPNYLTNPGWTKKEFNSIFTREMIFDERIILPIWYGVSKREIFEYCPSLVDTFALTWPCPELKSSEEYNKEVEELISKLHTAIVR